MKSSQKILYTIIFALVAVFIFLLCFTMISFVKKENATKTAAINACKHAQNIQENIEIPQEYLVTHCALSQAEKDKLPALDLGTCRKLSFFFVDKNNVYKKLFDPGSSETDQFIKVDRADAVTFIQLGFGYYRDKNRLYRDAGMSVEEISGINLNSVKVVSSHYLKDSQNVYFVDYENKRKPKIVTRFDVPTFDLVRNQQTIDHEVYFKDKNGIYFLGDKQLAELEKMENTDIDTFTMLNYYLLAKDKNHVYYNGTIVDQADSSSFEVMGSGYFKDNTRVFHTVGGVVQIFPGVDACSFELVMNEESEFGWGGYTRDKNHVYYQDKVVTDADPATFRVRGTAAFDKNYEFGGMYKK